MIFFTRGYAWNINYNICIVLQQYNYWINTILVTMYLLFLCVCAYIDIDISTLYVGWTLVLQGRTINVHDINGNI